MTTFHIMSLMILISSTISLNNGLGRTPQMGWNTWNKFACQIDEKLIIQTADTLISSGFVDAGYTYLNLDDCWQGDRDPQTGRITADPVRFPSGMAYLVNEIHSRGLKFGLYSDAGFKTCAGRPGSLGFEEIDAQQYAEWDVDYLKYDNCFNDGTSPKERFLPMKNALLHQSKKIFFSMCEWGIENPAEWAPEYANSWRTTPDISDTWSSFTKILDSQVGLEVYAGPGGWNDPDMLEVGNGGMTTNEYRAHFALWSIIKAPLLIGCDITKISQDTKNILLNKEIIAVNQDSLGIQGTRVQKDGDYEVWAVEVVDGIVVALFNRSYKQHIIGVDLSLFNRNGSLVRDIGNQRDIGYISNKIEAQVAAHSISVFKLQ